MGNYVCSKEKPWKSEMGGWVEHKDVEIESGWDCFYLRCENCGHEWKEYYDDCK